MNYYDIFNGDADGICALHQLRLTEPSDRKLITGVKRDIRLLEKVIFEQDDLVSVFDISINSNILSLKSGLKSGVSFEWFDHHSGNMAPNHPLLTTHLDQNSGTCTSLIVDKHINGRYRSWAIVACYGDNLHALAYELALEIGLTKKQIGELRLLGEAINYNSYGENVDDLHIAPDDLYQKLHDYTDPFEMMSSDNLITILQNNLQEDIQKGFEQKIMVAGNVRWVVLPNEDWARRSSGLLANRLHQMHPENAHLVMIEKPESYVVSIRRPQNHSNSAALIANIFHTGGGRAEAAGINSLKKSNLSKLISETSKAYKID